MCARVLGHIGLHTCSVAGAGMQRLPVVRCLTCAESLSLGLRRAGIFFDYNAQDAQPPSQPLPSRPETASGCSCLPQ